MTIFIIILMFIMTIYAIETIQKKSNISTIGRNSVGLASITITIITIAYNAACLYLLVKVL